MLVPGNTAQAKRQAARLRPAIVAVVLLAAAPADVHAQERCVFLCTPDLKIEPTLTIENTFGPARIEQVEDDLVLGTMRQKRDKVFEVVLAVGIPTEIQRVGFTFETIFSPFQDDTEVELELELNLTWLEPEQTGGWVESHFDIIDKFSPAQRPTDTTAYTHKLNFELDTAVLIFNWLAGGHLAPTSRSRGVARLRCHRAPQGRRHHRQRTVPGRCQPVVVLVRLHRPSRTSVPLKTAHGDAQLHPKVGERSRSIDYRLEKRRLR